MDKPYIILKGAGKRNTIVEWDDHSSTFESPTFASFADNIVVKSISFRVRNNNLSITNTLHFNNLLWFSLPLLKLFSYSIYYIKKIQ
jgi:hypothetical protein